ncbi:MAG: hypothetical protein R3282_10600 [Rhodothermales bacterium]|nr:hypothetical protein [Rhodothermales bacterium]
MSAFLCNSGGGASDDDLQKLEAEIMELIGDAEASDLQFCHAIAFGSKPCGGPWRYLVYSSEHTDSTLLRSKVDRYNRLQAEINREQGLVSDCALAVKPTVGYADGRCVAE